MMKNVLVNYGGFILFYLTIILCIIMVNARFNYLNSSNLSSDVIYAFNN